MKLLNLSKFFVPIAISLSIASCTGNNERSSTAEQDSIEATVHPSPVIIADSIALDASRQNEVAPGAAKSNVKYKESDKKQPKSNLTDSKSNNGSRYRVGAICRDGTQSSATGRGACSHHGGVAQWIYNK